mmetsp:Transcript_68468/g.164415  ORF Transcript_68468/g.164415 Transcript_68468/m.164415 type:complete len:226 (+) Transcript_68468:60-737(+)|eukprot:CAMPEP_0178412028 /NCGR_PEP_ID=MMETSP0689_2-20121128/21798_1 /TAXON_ID=160604 /ORGANISM="Amphidinium massartii, Strain CS-259" /LENGTH=225 /DNA_ID=CAMNT_0020033251 /DNA_START=46 /DNA_END=723 /DNA_ORIENTATION=-
MKSAFSAALLVVALSSGCADAAIQLSHLRGSREKPQVLHAQDTAQNPVVLEAPADDGTAERREAGARMAGFLPDVIFQICIALAYYALIVRNYPKLEGEASAKAKDFMKKNEVEAALDSSVSNCMLSWFCPATRAAHTFHATGLLSFWPSCCLMWFCQCPTLWVVNTLTDFNEKLGGTKKDCLMGCVCSFFCGCCLIAKDAEALDLSTGTKTHLMGLRHAGTSEH